MSDVAIRVENLGKQYRIGQSERYYRFSELLNGMLYAPLHGIRRLRQRTRVARVNDSQAPQHNTFWALRDVSFEVKKGEVLGIIGRNGSGKSTLLKILSRITEPTTGQAEIHGRVGSLLEVGTGFHPELTGRENVYLNGAILGMTRVEIKRKFDEIVDFSGVEQFLDTPVKRYSSGMYTRLAFAVAAHLEPEILIVDEVLAVGDAEFQRKCLGKMHDVAHSGRTVLFVSHNMNAVNRLCWYGIQLDQGQIAAHGNVAEVVDHYLNSAVDSSGRVAEFSERHEKPSHYVSAKVTRRNGEVVPELRCDEPIVISLCYRVREKVPGLRLAFHLKNFQDMHVLFSDIRDVCPDLCGTLDVGLHHFEIEIPPRLLAPNRYKLTVGSTTPSAGRIDHRDSCCTFTLRDLTSSRASRPGVLGIRLDWRHRKTDLSDAAVLNSCG